ncbi:MAG TPA: GntR family transcriptional regulator [Pseudolysinimonas sp.]|nr:GntR family transcriptional regulator [Pseudolysinimonas sp.]
MTELRIDPASPVPPFEQLKHAIVEAARSGSLPAGAKLPTVRGLAGELSLAPGTVARAYRELEELGVIETHGRAGSFLAWSDDAAQAELQRLAVAFRARADELGVDPARARAILDEALR